MKKTLVIFLVIVFSSQEYLPAANPLVCHSIMVDCPLLKFCNAEHQLQQENYFTNLTLGTTVSLLTLGMCQDITPIPASYQGYFSLAGVMIGSIFLRKSLNSYNKASKKRNQASVKLIGVSINTPKEHKQAFDDYINSSQSYDNQQYMASARATCAGLTLYFLKKISQSFETPLSIKLFFVAGTAGYAGYETYTLLQKHNLRSTEFQKTYRLALDAPKREKVTKKRRKPHSSY